MGVCKSKTQKLNSQTSGSSRHLKIKTQPTETLPSNQEIKLINTTYGKQKTMTNGTSPLSDGIMLTQRSRRKLTRLPQTNFQLSLESMKQILIPTCASKKYTLIRKKQGNEAIQVVSNNKSGKIMYMETLGKHEPHNKNYICWLQNTQIDHPNIIRVSEIFENQKFYQIIYEHFEENTLCDLIQEAKKVPKSQVSQILQQILQILQYLHEQKIYHGNLSMKSFSYKIQNDSSYLIKLIDLKGIIVKQDDDVDKIKFTPPEYLYSAIHDAARDKWASVLIAYTLRKGQFPIEIQEPITVLTAKVLIKNHIYGFEEKKDKVFKDFLSQSLNKNPKKRLSLEKLLSHEFITQYEVPKKSDQELLLYNILSAKPSCLLQQLMLSYFVQEYNWEEYLKIQKLFLEGDQDMDGLMSKEELLMLLKKYHFQDDIEEKVSGLFQQLELKDNLNSTQFLTLVSSRKEVLTQQNIETCFSIFSMNTQSITIRGLKKYLSIDDLEEVKEQFSQLTSEQNSLNLEQFQKLLEFLI